MRLPKLKNYLWVLILGFVLSGCESNSGYDFDNGYEAAWNGEKAPTRFSSQEYHNGYEQGLQDAAMYDEGFYDGYKRKEPKFPKDLDYMDGYKDGKKRR